MSRWVRWIDSGNSELQVRATTSGTIAVQLLSGTTGIDLSTVGTVELWLKDNAGGTKSFTTVGASPTLAVIGTAAGSINFLPGTGALIAGSAPYRAYFKLCRSSASWDFVPEASELTIDVRETY